MVRGVRVGGGAGSNKHCQCLLYNAETYTPLTVEGERERDAQGHKAELYIVRQS